ncbi:MAG: glucose-6-phosphate isomerase [Oscillospiraceae bacterium]|nr:glucose-6-phosphate isomerase [Oscillospiraceae bacterium]
MMQVQLSNVRSFLPLPYEAALAPRLRHAHRHLRRHDGAGSDFTGWVELPRDYDREEFARIKAAAKKIQGDSRALVVIGIGGSYLGARGVIECLCSANYNLKKKDTPNIYFVGNGLSSDYLSEIMELLDGVDFSVNVISKSGTTTEPAVAFRFFRRALEERYGAEGAAKRIYATTDRARGALKTLADSAGYETFVVPDDVGGRYSVLSAVGLLPIAVAGVDIDELMAGAAEMMEVCAAESMEQNPAWQYAGARYELYRHGKRIEILAAYEPNFRFMAEWWKQLYGESEGKENKGLFPASVEFTADLHSMGQYIQQGERNLLETVVRFGASRHENPVPFDEQNGDGLNFLAGKPMDFIARQAMDGTLLAHVEGGVPNIILQMGELNAHTLGELIYFFEYACGLSGYLLDVNPFDQPGVEAYKKNMFALLGKPGYEERRQELLDKLSR